MKTILKSTILMIIAAVLISEPAFAALPDDDVLDMFDSSGIYYYNPNGSDDLCGSSSTKLTGNTIEEKIWNFYIDNGFNDAQAAGILGNAKQETGLEPTRASNSSFFGLFQWGHSRRTQLINKLTDAGLGQYTQPEYWPAGASKKIPENDLDRILEIELELSLTENDYDWQTEVKKQTTPEAAAEAFLAIFERAVNGESPILYYTPYIGLYYQGTANRRKYAREFYDEYAGKGRSTSSSSKEDGKNLTIFGDSITVASKTALLAQFPDLTEKDIYAQNGRKWNEAVDIAKSKKDIKDNVIFALGANSSNLTSQDIDNAIKAIGTNKNITFVTDWSTTNNYKSNNDLFFEFANKNSNIVVADWAKEVAGKADKYLYDYIHPNDEGAKLFAKTLYDTVNSNINSKGCAINGNFESLVKAYAWPEYHKGPYLQRMPEYANAVTKSISEGRYVGGSVNGVPGIDCGGFVTVITQNSGLEPNYNDGNGATGEQEAWVKRNGWRLLNGSEGTPVDTSILQAGDIAFSSGHTFIYVGEIQGFDSVIASASYSFSSGRAPMAGREDLIHGNGVIVRWYRNPKYSSGNGTSYQQNLQNTVWSN